MTEKTVQEYYTPRELAKKWRVKYDRILDLIHTGRLRAFSTSPASARRRHWRITAAAVQEFEDRNATAPAPSAPRAKPRKRSYRKYYPP